jgi:hypothetical protein
MRWHATVNMIERCVRMKRTQCVCVEVTQLPILYAYHGLSRLPCPHDLSQFLESIIIMPHTMGCLACTLALSSLPLAVCKFVACDLYHRSCISDMQAQRTASEQYGNVVGSLHIYKWNIIPALVAFPQQMKRLSSLNQHTTNFPRLGVY